MMRFILIIFISALIFTACQKAETQTDTGGVKRYDLKGKVVSVDRQAKRATIDHEAIPDFMPAMTMDFPIREDWVWDDLTPGSEIRAQLVVDNTAKDPYWLEKIGIIAISNPNLPPPPAEKVFEQIGKPIPDFSLTDQDGKRFSFNDYRGKAWAITFIYRECPLADFCIRMSQAFSDVANQIAADGDAREKVRLLSISFDPERDTPAKLKEYGLGYLGKDSKAGFDIWQLAVGTEKEIRAVADYFDLKYEVDPNDKTQISHSLVTAVISPEGKVTKIFAGNRWTTEDLLRELQFALK